MPIVDMKKEFANLNSSDQHFIKKLEKLNTDRAKDIKVVRGRNKLTALAISAAVIGIYAYTILSVKQEKFLDDFDTTEIKKKAP